MTTCPRGLPSGASSTNPIDLTFGAEASDYDWALRTVLADDDVDSVLVIFASALPAQHDGVAAVIVAAHADNPTKPVLASVLGVGDRGFATGRATSFPCSRSPRRPRRRSPR